MDQHVAIRRYEASDIEAIWEAVKESRAELSRWMAWCHANYSRDDVTEWVIGRPSAWESNQEWGFVVEGPQDSVLGACGIHRIDLLNQVGELGYWIRSSSTGRGCATEATRQLLRWAFDETPLHRLELVIAEENKASLRVARKVGGVEEGLLRKRTVVNNTHQDCVLFAILKDEFRKQS